MRAPEHVRISRAGGAGRWRDGQGRRCSNQRCHDGVFDRAGQGGVAKKTCRPSTLLACSHAIPYVEIRMNGQGPHARRASAWTLHTASNQADRESA